MADVDIYLLGHGFMDDKDEKFSLRDDIGVKFYVHPYHLADTRFLKKIVTDGTLWKEDQAYYTKPGKPSLTVEPKEENGIDDGLCVEHYFVTDLGSITKACVSLQGTRDPNLFPNSKVFFDNQEEEEGKIKLAESKLFAVSVQDHPNKYVMVTNTESKCCFRLSTIMRLLKEESSPFKNEKVTIHWTVCRSDISSWKETKTNIATILERPNSPLKDGVQLNDDGWKVISFCSDLVKVNDIKEIYRSS